MKASSPWALASASSMALPVRRGMATRGTIEETITTAVTMKSALRSREYLTSRSRTFMRNRSPG